MTHGRHALLLASALAAAAAKARAPLPQRQPATTGNAGAAASRNDEALAGTAGRFATTDAAARIAPADA